MDPKQDPKQDGKFEQRLADIEDARKSAARLMQGIYNEPHYVCAFATEMARHALTNNTKKHLRALLDIAARLSDANVLFGPHQGE